MKPHALALVTLLAACDSASSSESEPKAPQHSEAEVTARADEVYATFRTWHDNLPELDAPAKTCNDEEIAGFGTKNHEITYLAYQSLRRTLGEPWDGTNSMVRFMTDSKLRYAPREKFDVKKEHNVKQLMRMWNFVEYVGVVVPTHERKAKALGSTTGSGGALKGQLVIFRKGEPDPLCHTPFDVVSTSATSYSAALGASESEKTSKATHALKKQTCYDLRKGLEERIGTLTGALKAGYIECNAV
ncbi:MAG: hypothetical protein ACE37F_23985 [Nannocystaceae bacterium]|nr:hypothetical protein [bacterium]